MDRATWEAIAEESLARVFRAAGGGLSLPGLDGRGPDPAGDSDPSGSTPDLSDGPGGRQGFRLGLTGHGTSFTGSIGAAFHFQALRQLTAASGRQLGLKAVIVVRGQVVLLPDAAADSGPIGDRIPGSIGSMLRSTAGSIGIGPGQPPSRTLLGQAELVPVALKSAAAPARIGPALCPLWPD